MWDMIVMVGSLFVLAMITVHLISWIGGVLHSVPNGGNSRYAVFTFRSDQDKPMSVNVLMNILIPGVILIFLHMLFFYHNRSYEQNYLICYVIFYYVYRFVLICFILKRRELFNICYELINFLMGFLVAFFLTKIFLANPEEIFIPVSELKNEFWLVVIAIIYKFSVIFLDKVYTQKKVVNEQMLDKYIRNKFDYLYSKYNDIIIITEKDREIWILLFSIMIFENYNRGRIKRIIERIKVYFGKSATLGIMQIESNVNISDAESIALAYKKLKYEIVQGMIEADDEMQIEYYAFQYNPDEDYAKSIAFIYQHLYKYLKLMPRYCNVFHLEEKKEGHEIDELSMEKQEEAFSEENNFYTIDEQEETSFEENNFYTIDDIVQMTGLTRKQVKKKVKKKKIAILIDRNEAERAFEKYLPKG